ncbi:MAG TPA: GNAT family N-acetyltransferase [Gaiellaceae bacterium]|nr:GNAT family N-acetyltransferase [Gaiellaceae bacterium]
MTIEYRDTVDGIDAAHLAGFFAGWPDPPSRERHLDLLRRSTHRVLALDRGQVVGFVTAVSDGVLSAYVPLLEVLPGYQRRGIGTELMRRVLAKLEGLYMVDLSCDAELEPFYRRLGMLTLDRGMGLRNRKALAE